MTRTPPPNSCEDYSTGYVQRIAQYWDKKIKNEGNYVPYPPGSNHESSHGQQEGSKCGYQHGCIPQVEVPTQRKGRKSEGDQSRLELHGSGYGFEDRRRAESAEPGYGRKPSSCGEEVEGSRGGTEMLSNMTREGVGSEKPSNFTTLEGAGSEKPSHEKPSNIKSLEGVGSEKPSDYGGGEEGKPHNGAEGNDHNEQGMSVKPKKTNFDFPPSTSKGRFQIIKSNELKEIGKLGSGAFGTVYHGKWGHIDVAIKRINERFAGELQEEHMRNDFLMEANKLAELQHPNVVTFYGVVFDNPGDPVAIVTEYMDGGSLRIALQKNKRDLDKMKCLFIAMDVAFGMKYLHSKDIIHFDLKSDNLLVNLYNLKRRNGNKGQHTPICKVGDLGLSKVKRQTLISCGVRGTLPWMAPELLKNHNNHVSEKIDVFSFGIVMWELMTGKEPYADLHDGEIIGGIINNTLRPLVPNNCHPDWRSLMERCWSNEPSERPSFIEIVHDLEAMATN